MVPKTWVIICLLLISSRLVCSEEGSYLTLPGNLRRVPLEGTEGNVKPQVVPFKEDVVPADWGEPYGFI
jgi:hypothetical protein